MEIEVLTGSRDAGDRQFTVFDSDAAPADERMIERLGQGTEGAGLAVTVGGVRATPCGRGCYDANVSRAAGSARPGR